MAFNEGPPSMRPVLRPRGINLKVGILFSDLLHDTMVCNEGHHNRSRIGEDAEDAVWFECIGADAGS